MSAIYTSPVGRLVQGDVFTGSDKDQQGNPRVVKTGPNVGTPQVQWFAGVAFAKNDPAWPAFYALLYGVAATAWPQYFPQGVNGACTNPKFAFKIIDGDGHDEKGQPWNTREGFAGHWVVRFTNGFPPKVVRHMGGGTYVEVTNPKEMKRGDYVQMSGNIVTNGNQQNPGVYVNFNLVNLVGFGQEIQSGPDAAQAFGSTSAALPPGASPIPLAPAAAPPPGAAPPPLPAQAPPGMPAPAAAPPPIPGAGAPPYPGYMATPGGPPPAPAAPPPAPPPARQMTAAAGGVTYEAFIQQGWTEDQMRQAGYLV